MATCFRVGDRVRCLANCNEGKVGTVINVTCEGRVYVIYDDGCEGNARKPGKYYQLICRAESNKAATPKMSLISKLMLSLKSEPEKSFIKAGVKNADGSFTCEGKELFINWLAQDEATMAKFNADVVQPILEQIKEEKDCK